MRIALVHDYFVQDGGAERVFAAIHRLFPEAPVFTLLADTQKFPPGFSPKKVVTSGLQRFLPSTKWYPLLTPFMPMASEHLDLSGFDVAIISSSSFAKGVIVPPSTRTICYLHTPTRFLWEARHNYPKDRGWPWLSHLPLKASFHRLRSWDYLAAQRPEILLTNSQLSQARIKRYYQRDAEILYPPLDLANIPFSRTSHGQFWLTGGRLVSYKRFDLCIEAANALNVHLKIYGSGPDLGRLKRMAGKTIEFVGQISESLKHELHRDAIAFLHPHLEDFGVSVLEVLAAGTPVIAYGAGGALETISHGVSGVLFPESNTASLIDAMQQFDHTKFDPAVVRQQTLAFDLPRFEQRLKAIVYENTR